MEAAGVSNDTRGWIMCIVSGLACIIGACVICVDLLIRHIPGKETFSIQDNNPFLACSLSLSFGVMIFSALFSMLPESKDYLKKDDWSESNAGLIMMACFVAGFIGIQAISRLLHQIMPSHVVDCDHSHAHDDPDEEDHKHSHAEGRQHSRVGRPKLRMGRRVSNSHTHHGASTEASPLLGSQANGRSSAEPRQSAVSAAASDALNAPRLGLGRRPSMMEMRKRVMSFVKDTKSTCDEGGPCFGYSDPCGQGCFKHLSSRSSIARRGSFGVSQTRTSPFSPTAPLFAAVPETESEVDSGTRSPLSPALSHTRASDVHTHHSPHAHGHHEHDHEYEHSHEHASEEPECDQMSLDLEAQDAAHHHHVPTNAFLSIGLQTVIAIALHKFPEGFITYATNHANPQLGFNVFMALFVHNIAEGFSMALPLYMALGSRFKAIAWSSLLGGFSQPLGAAIAWLVFKLVGNHAEHPSGTIGIDNTAYAALFAATAGIMTSVALQLFVESLGLNHNRNLSIAFAFLGMVLLGVSNAVAGHSH
ncbi:Zinc/iron permease [Cryphonectria parasitica EP155]|uniref:Zinc/iron permease n=1 Tax=Cryphonectria parasitica (strain ATCC 38755 / EP155) TaxID=660469 RepID=A0A9P4YAB3_CRYP1|nr:Zinc/iron permease [Cryphonectria parasitica EP155]KAF3769837.1 Zinc/iron permease [Cryphonectria parasitica EP155]